MLIKQHKKDKAFGPGPKNNYTTGTAGRRRFWQRKNRGADPEHAMAGAKHHDALPAHTTPYDARTSYATDTTAVGHGPVGTAVPHTKAGNF